MNATRVVAINIEEASAKIRFGPPSDDAEDYALPIWAGVLPMEETPQTPLRDDPLPKEISVPDYVTGYARSRKR